MTWTIEKILHNTSVLYNNVCSDDSNVYADEHGYLQVDNRWTVSQYISPKGDSSCERIDEITIATLKNLLEALERKEINSEKLIIQERMPLGYLMKDASHPENWIDTAIFGYNVGNAARFSLWTPSGKLSDDELNYAQAVRNQVHTLTKQIILGTYSS